MNPMLTVEALVRTDRPSRYLVQLCKHASAMGGARGHRPRSHLGAELERQEVRVRAEWSETEGVVSLEPWGRCTLRATGNTLLLHVEATDEEGLHQIQDVIARNLDRMGRRDRLTVHWNRFEAPSPLPGKEQAGGTPTVVGTFSALRNNRKPIILGTLVVLAIVLHLGLGGAALVQWQWTAGVTAVVGVVVLGKVLLVLLGGHAIGRGGLAHGLRRVRKPGPAGEAEGRDT